MRITQKDIDSCSKPEDFFKAMVDAVGAPSAASAIGVSLPFMSQLANGRRGCSPETAERASKAFPQIRKEWLIWPKSDGKDANFG